MFVLTVDQIDSRGSEEDAVAGVLLERDAWRRDGAVLGPDRTAGDEFQLVYADAGGALAAALRLRRHGAWSVGIGAGEVRQPLPGTTGAARGEAFLAARTAVDAAKRAQHHLAVSAPDGAAAAGVSALIGLLLELRSRRSPEGWEVADLLDEGLSQAAAAERLGVTPQAVSLRARAAGTRLEHDAIPALVRALASLDVAP
ncbi:DNA-binding protein [Amnibacterium kyonggiense]